MLSLTASNSRRISLKIDTLRDNIAANTLGFPLIRPVSLNFRFALFRPQLGQSKSAAFTTCQTEVLIIANGTLRRAGDEV